MRRLAVLLTVPLLFVGAACGGDDDDDAAGGDSSSGFCVEAREVDERFSELESSFDGDEIPSADVFDDAADTLADLADDAPGDVKDDLETIVDGVRKIADVFEDIDLSDPNSFTDPDTMAALEDIGDEMEDIGDDVEAASDRVETYLRDECGIDISGDDDGSSDDGSTEDGS